MGQPMKQGKFRTPLLRNLLILLAGVAPAPAGAFGAETSTQEADQAPRDPVEPVYSVVSPLGDPVVKMITMGPRLETLAGKTVCMVWNEAFKADVTLPAIGESLKEKYPDIKIIPHTEVDAAIEAAERENPSADEAAILRAVLKEKGCDALISGNGG